MPISACFPVYSLWLWLCFQAPSCRFFSFIHDSAIKLISCLLSLFFLLDIFSLTNKNLKISLKNKFHSIQPTYVVAIPQVLVTSYSKYQKQVSCVSFIFCAGKGRWKGGREKQWAASHVLEAYPLVYLK